MTKTVDVDPQKIEELELCYLSPFTIERFETIYKKGKFGEYAWGYKVSLSTREGGKFFVELSRTSVLYAQLHGSIMRNQIKSFSAERGEDKDIKLSQVLQP